MLDGFGQKDRETLGGSNGDVYWLKVSPEVVHATIGGVFEMVRQGFRAPPKQVSSQLLDGRVRSVEIFDSSGLAPAAQQKPVYQWKSQDGLKSGSNGTETASPFSCGNIIMPQRHFVVNASVRLDHADEKGVIFSALTERSWQQQAVDPTDPIGNTRGHDVPRAQVQRLVFWSHFYKAGFQPT
jgi:hypothetical protein